jgi:hypothetical protein
MNLYLESENTQNNLPTEQSSDNQRNAVLLSQSEQDTTGEAVADQAAPTSSLGQLLDATQDDINRRIANSEEILTTRTFK